MSKEKTISKAQLIILLGILFKEETIKISLKHYPEDRQFGEKETYEIVMTVVKAYLAFIKTINKSIFK